MLKYFAAVIMILISSLAHAQVLTTADTLGKGKQAVVVSENHLYDTDVDLNIAYAMYIRGLTPKIDLYVSVGHTHILGQNQAYLGIGGNAHLFSVRGISVSLFEVASVPLHRMEESSTVLANTAIVVSWSFNSQLSVYTGVNTLVPIGARARGLFTPVDNKLNVPLGTALTLGNWGIYVEWDIGKMKALGMGLSKTF